MRMRVLSTKWRVKIENDAWVYLETLDIEMRVCRSLIPRLPILYEHLCVVWKLFHTKDTSWASYWSQGWTGRTYDDGNKNISFLITPFTSRVAARSTVGVVLGCLFLGRRLSFFLVMVTQAFKFDLFSLYF